MPLPTMARSDSFSTAQLLPGIPNNEHPSPSSSNSPFASPEGSTVNLAGPDGQFGTYGSSSGVHGRGDSYSTTSSARPFRGGPAGVSTQSSLAPTVSEKFAIPLDGGWGQASFNGPEDDDFLHNPDPKRDRHNDHGGSMFTPRGLANLGCLFILSASILMLFAGYPILSYYDNKGNTKKTIAWEWDLAKINGSLQAHDFIQGRNFTAIDPATPSSAMSMTSDSGETWNLVFSDEFEVDGRTFYDGDDPYWQAIDLHAWSTGDLEWYDPRYVTTKNGALRITMANVTNHNLYYQSAEIQSWNRLCFVGGRLEASVKIPGRADVYGLWPAVWTMGNLGRVGYGATTEGMWPYTYNSCDVGAAPNQTLNNEPLIATAQGKYGVELSYLPGQRLSRCVCPSEYHPGPQNADGSWKGRSAPEIDVFEAQTDDTTHIGQVSQSSQWAPFNAQYDWDSATYMDIFDTTITTRNSYSGGQYQQASSGVSQTNQNCYEYGQDGTTANSCFAVYAFEYQPGEDGYITWFSDAKKMWTFEPGGMGKNDTVGVSARPVPYEPMYVIINLALSLNFGEIDYTSLESLWPVTMEVEYIRIYQDTSGTSNHTLGCDPESAPTSAYIEKYAEGYNNPNLTTWAEMNGGVKDLPKNSLTGSC